MDGKYLLLGTNLGDRLLNIKTAFKQLEAEMDIIETSSLFESEPWGIKDQPWFLNVVIKVKSNLGPANLLSLCLEVEKNMGRIRKKKWGERLIDIDILYYDNLTLNNNILTIPHKEIQNRRFTLLPMTEISPEGIHPVFNKTQKQLLEECSDTLICRKIKETP